jgi:predicted ATPase
MAHALAAWAFVLLRDFARVEEITCSDAILASDPPLPLWTATTAVMRGWAWVHRGRTDEGLAETDRGFQAYLDSLGDASSFDYRVLRCEAYARAGRVDEAAAMVEDALENLRTYRQGYFAPELHRIRGEVLLARGGDPARDAARAAWREGLELARARGARSSALRLAMALARTSATQDEGTADRGIVAELVASIEPGEESDELAAARRLAG